MQDLNVVRKDKDRETASPAADDSTEIITNGIVPAIVRRLALDGKIPWMRGVSPLEPAFDDGSFDNACRKENSKELRTVLYYVHLL